MTTVTLDEKAITALNGGDNLVAIQNAAGETVGFYAPVRQEYADEYALVAAKSFSARGGQPRKPLTTPEVIAHLESLERGR